MVVVIKWCRSDRFGCFTCGLKWFVVVAADGCLWWLRLMVVCGGCD